MCNVPDIFTQCCFVVIHTSSYMCRVSPSIAELSAAHTGSLWIGLSRYPTGLDLGSVYANRLKES